MRHAVTGPRFTGQEASVETLSTAAIVTSLYTNGFIAFVVFASVAVLMLLWPGELRVAPRRSVVLFLPLFERFALLQTFSPQGPRGNH
jgi:hypothetical protein